MTKITLRRIFSKHVLLKRTQFRLTQAQLAEAVGTSHGWIQKIESGKKRSGRISFAKRQRDMVCRCLVE